MQIAMIAPEQFPLPGGGSVEICMEYIAKELAARHRVTVVSRRVPGRPNVSRNGGFTNVRVPSGSSRTYLGSVTAFLKVNHFDIIQVDNRPHYAAKLKSRFPRTTVSLFLHSLTFVPKTAAVYKSLKQADLIIANSASLRRRLARRFPAIARKLRSVHLGVDESRFAPPDALQKRAAKAKYRVGKGFTILFAGRVIPRKGVPVAIKAARLVRRSGQAVTLVVAGKPKPKNYGLKLQRYARKLKVPVRFVGNVPYPAIHELYRAADCFLCPSQLHEGFGLVNVEAMATGVPVIASKIGGIQEIITHKKNGYLVKKYWKPRHFAKYILRIARNKQLAARLSRAGRRTVIARFPWRSTAAKLEKLYSGR